MTGCSWFGDRAVSVPAEDPASRRALATLLAAALPGYEVRHGMQSLLVVAGDPDPGLLSRVSAAASAADTHEPDLAPAGDVPDGEEVQVPVRYDGPDVDDVARLLGCSRQALTDAHHAQEWTVAMVGFAPGFGYLVPDGPSLLDWSSLPRRSSPRKQVPVGSVAIAAGMSGIYPTVMPGGWHLIGRTDVPMFDPADESRPALLRPGDRVRFVVEP